MSLSLSKGQRIDLTKGSSLSRIFLGLGWDVGDDDDIDVDASCIMFDASRSEAETAVFFSNKSNSNGSVIHGGDNLTGSGDGDDEVIEVDLARVPSSIQHLVFVITSWSQHTFEEIGNAFCRLVDATNGRELARFDMSGTGDHTALIAVRVYRYQGEWKLQAVGQPAEGKSYRDVVGQALATF